MSDYYDYDYDSDSYDRPEDRIRNRFRTFEQTRSALEDEGLYEEPPEDGSDGPGCQRYTSYGCIAVFLLFALFRGGIFEGEISLPRRGCQWLMTLGFAGIAMVGGAVLVSNNNGSADVVAGLGICGSLLCLGSSGGVIAVIVMGTRLLSMGGLVPEEMGGFNIMDRFGGGGQ